MNIERKGLQTEVSVTCVYVRYTTATYTLDCREYIGQLSQYRGQCGEVLEEAESALSTLAAMRERHQFVSQRTGALHTACEQLMEDQVSHVDIETLVLYSSRARGPVYKDKVSVEYYSGTVTNVMDQSQGSNNMFLGERI